MNQGFLIRMSLWCRLWVRSVIGLCLLIVIPLVIWYLLRNMGTGELDFASRVYEQLAVLIEVLVLQWCFSIDFDSKFLPLLFSFPQRKIPLLLERILFGSLTFVLIMIIITLVLPYTRVFMISVPVAFLFSLPVYVTVGGLVVLGTVLFNHSLGGLFFGLLYWSLTVGTGDLFGAYQTAILHFNRVYLFAEHITEVQIWQEPADLWIIKNRLMFVVAGIALHFLSFRLFNRKTVKS